MDVKATAVKGFRGARDIFLKDLQALPEEAFFKSFGEACRTVADIVYEVNLVNEHVTLAIREEEQFPWPDEQWIKAPPGLDSKDAIIASFVNSTENVLATLDGYSEAEYETPIREEDGETTRFERCRFMTLHLWYHSGQLNFIQTLMGDSEWHW